MGAVQGPRHAQESERSDRKCRMSWQPARLGCAEARMEGRVRPGCSAAVAWLFLSAQRAWCSSGITVFLRGLLLSASTAVAVCGCGQDRAPDACSIASISSLLACSSELDRGPIENLTIVDRVAACGEIALQAALSCLEESAYRSSALLGMLVLERLKSHGSAQLVERLLLHPDSEVRLRAATFLLYYGDLEVSDALREVVVVELGHIASTKAGEPSWEVLIIERIERLDLPVQSASFMVHKALVSWDSRLIGAALVAMQRLGSSRIDHAMIGPDLAELLVDWSWAVGAVRGAQGAYDPTVEPGIIDVRRPVVQVISSLGIWGVEIERAIAGMREKGLRDAHVASEVKKLIDASRTVGAGGR